MINLKGQNHRTVELFLLNMHLLNMHLLEMFLPEMYLLEMFLPEMYRLKKCARENNGEFRTMGILIGAAILPPLILMYLVYRQDTIEKEPVNLIFKVFLMGAVSCLPAILLELLMEYPQELLFQEGSVPAIIFENFIGVALIEELCKFVSARTIWKNPQFNYRFDGIVYAVAASLGFAAVENILYVMDGGLGLALSRAIISVPGHCIFGIFMGFYFGDAKYWECRGNQTGKNMNLIQCILIPVLLHGLYDSLLSFEYQVLDYVFFAFVLALDFSAIWRIKKSSSNDRAFV